VSSRLYQLMLKRRQKVSAFMTVIYR